MNIQSYSSGIYKAGTEGMRPGHVIRPLPPPALVIDKNICRLYLLHDVHYDSPGHRALDT